jgi:hypothetical protein
VHQALDMAQTGKQAMAGVDFMTQLEHSAVAGGVAFTRAASALGIDPASLSTDTRAMLDRQLQARFDTASETPVQAETAAQWVTAHLAAHLSHQNPSSP